MLRTCTVLFTALLLIAAAISSNAQGVLPPPPAPAPVTASDALLDSFDCAADGTRGCEELRSLYASSNGTEWILNEGWWDDGSAVCYFTGVRCVTATLPVVTRIVSRVDLTANNLTGVLPPALPGLVGTASLDLSNNHIAGEIPASLFADAAQFSPFDLSGNMLSGSLPVSFAVEPVSLAGIDLNYNMLETTDPALLNVMIATGWIETQTVPPTGLHVTGVDDTTVILGWNAIAYTGDGGGYEIRYRPALGGEWVVKTLKFDKTASMVGIGGLQQATTYVFEIRTVTPAHENNPNTLVTRWAGGDNGAAVSATTGGDVPDTTFRSIEAPASGSRDSVPAPTLSR